MLPQRQHWNGLVLSLFLNYHHELWYELLTGWMGKGDKVGLQGLITTAQCGAHQQQSQLGMTSKT